MIAPAERGDGFDDDISFPCQSGGLSWTLALPGESGENRSAKHRVIRNSNNKIVT
jgi:hypothetical protein